MRDDTNASLLLEEIAELRHQNAELEHQNINLQLSLAHYQNMALEYAIGTGLEITEQRQVERTLHQSEESFRSLFENAPVGISIYNDDGQVLLVNQALTAMTGYNDPSELRNMPTIAHIAPDCRQEIAERLEKRQQGESVPRLLETRGLRKDGSTFPIFVEVAGLELPDAPANVAFVSDITEQERVQQEIREQLHFLQVLIDTIPAPIFYKDLKGVNQGCNDAFLGALGVCKEDIIGKTVYDIYPEEQADKYHKKDRELLDNPGIQVYEYKMRFADGADHDVIFHKATYADSTGRLAGLVGVMIDITERKQAEEALRKSEEHFRLLAENARDIIYRKHLAPTYMEYVSPSAAAILGYTPEEIYADPELVNKAIHPEDLTRFLTLSPDEFQKPQIFRMAKKDGVVIYTEHHGTPILDDAGMLTAVEGIVRDITKRKQAEEALRSSEERFSKAFDSGPCMMAIISHPDYRVVYVNQHWLSTVGYALDEVIGKTINEIGYWPESQFQQMIGSLDQRGSVHNLDIVFRNKQGRQRYGLWSGETITINGERCLLGATIDITELKQFEQEMARLDRLNLVGEMAAGLAHEIRNPLTVVRGYLQLLQHKEEFISYHKKFNTMIEEIDRANAIITEFLSLARNAPVDLRRQSINSIVSALSPLIHADAAKNGIAISIDLAETTELYLDEKQIRQLVLNLVRNGIEAMSRYGELAIKTRRKGNGVELIIKDRGQGIPPEVLAKLGTPFFTTKEKGTGLGLAVCYRIAENHHAKIQIRTGARGTTFIVRFKIIPLRNTDMGLPGPAEREI